MALKHVPQGGGNSLSNETALHESEDDDVETDVDTSQQPVCSPMTCVSSSLTSTVKDNTAPSTPAAAASVSLSAPSQVSTSSSQLVTSQDGNSEIKDVTSSEEDSLCEENISLEESSPTTTSDCITSPTLAPSTVECSSVSSTSHPPAADTTLNVAPADTHTTDTVEEVGVTDTSLSSSSIALPDVATPLDETDDDMEASTSSSANGDTVAIEENGNSCRRTPARHAKLNRVPYTDKDENKVTDNIY